MKASQPCETNAAELLVVLPVSQNQRLLNHVNLPELCGLGFLGLYWETAQGSRCPETKWWTGFQNYKLVNTRACQVSFLFLALGSTHFYHRRPWLVPKDTTS